MSPDAQASQTVEIDGLGVLREVSYLAEAEVLSMKKKSKTRPWALRGGQEPEPSEMVIWPETDRAVRVGMYRATLAAGDRFINRTAGGGGYGDPLTRTPEAVLADVLDGYISVETAECTYGVVVRPDGSWHPTDARLTRVSAS